ncbi:beta-lactamase-like protein-like protein 2 [Podospora fimiseda]|uniref:Beta-lactamase-like protein-like protein 2 n=1 Tax=Podospora fimiseda TaxID=252190 RepID=A0AAN7GVQ3_9PEZI|nr:beta-lactamase-like protein-like protein 2 [Podospora fimiseda]
MLPTSKYHLLALSATAAIWTQASGKPCPPLGAVLPASRQPSKEPIVAEALRIFADKFVEIVYEFNSSAVSIGLQSIHEDEPMFDIHFTPVVRNENGTDKVTRDTVYRVGSISKIFTVLAVLQESSISFEDPVTKYLPSLNTNQPNGSSIEAAQWDQVTVGSLASHVSGIGRDFGLDLAVFPFDITAAKLPPSDNSTRPNCSGLPGTRLCTGEDLLVQFPRRHPQFAPFTKPLYSSVGISLLALVVEAATNKTLDELMRDKILKPAGMESTSLVTGPPDNSMGFIPDGEKFWNVSLGINDANGGMYSTTADMLKFGKAILKHQLLSPAKTNKWLQPTSFTSSRGQVLGAPWEIQRADRLAPNGRVVDVFTKAGDLGGYHSMFALIPEYDLVLSVMTAGKEVSGLFSVQTNLVSQTLKAIVPALEAVSKKDAQVNLAGEYRDGSSFVALDIDEGPGLVLSNWTVDGFDVLRNFLGYSAVAPSTKPIPGKARLYPSGLKDGNKTSWRMVFDQVDDVRGEEFDQAVVFQDGSCINWGTMDKFVYDSVGLEEFVFTMSDGGKAESITPSAFEVTLPRLAK